MSTEPLRTFDPRSWLAALLGVAATYFFFLIFAEFAFLELASTIAPDATGLRWVMAGLGAGGITGAILAALIRDALRARALVWGFLGCAFSAFASTLATSLIPLLATSVAIGCSLGWLTVTLAASLRRATGNVHLGVCIGGGTGLAYAACNIPAVFHAAPEAQALAAGFVAAAASVLPIRLGQPAPSIELKPEAGPSGVGRWALMLMALVWMDSAAFYIIQHTAPLHAVTWREPAELSANAVVHLAVAIGAGLLLDRRRRGILALGAVIALSLACLVLGGFLPATLRPGWLYTAGVSAYSALLVEYPARDGRPWVAAVVFGVSGWIGSALGIGMAQDLNHIPVEFVAVAAALLGLGLVWRARALRRAGIAAALLGVLVIDAARGDESALIGRGREVYIAEGCIHCHSQYVRPRSPSDIALWGPPTVLTDALTATPPLFGTRRQGPDLSNVGSRRSAEWNRLHLIEPRDVSPGSRMPSYAYLFSGSAEAGESLIAYLGSLGRESIPARQAQCDAWSPDTSRAATLEQSSRLFRQMCTPCHGPAGRGDGRLAGRLSLRPPDWTQPGWRRVPAAAEVELALARIIKFGLPGTPMAGHEYLPDAEIVGLARFVRSLHSPDGVGPSVAARR